MSTNPRWAQPAYSGRVGKKRRELVKIGRFTVVGTVAFFVDVGVFNLLMLTVLQGHPVWSKTVAVLCATAVSWIGSRRWTFADQESRYRPAFEGILFFAINAAGMGIALLTLWASHDVLGFTSLLADNISGNVIGLLLGNIMRYFAYRSWLYRGKSHRREVLTDTSSDFGNPAPAPESDSAQKADSAVQNEQRDGELG